MTVYIDIIFLENLFMNYIILFATGIILRAPPKIIRTLISSAIGSIYAIISYMSLVNITSNTFLKIILSIVMVYIAFGSKKPKLLLKQLTIFYLTSFTFGGVAFALIYVISPQNVLMEKGVLIGINALKIVLVGGIFGFIIITTAFKNIKGRLTHKDMFCSIKINLNNKNTYIKAIIDTGNFLREPITKTPVIVVQKDILKEIIPSIIIDNLDKILKGENVKLGNYASKIRAIPFSSLGKDNGILLGIKADNILVESEESVITVDDVIIGIYNGKLSKNGSYQALIGLDVIENRYELYA